MASFRPCKQTEFRLNVVLMQDLILWWLMPAKKVSLKMRDNFRSCCLGPKIWCTCGSRTWICSKTRTGSGWQLIYPAGSCKKFVEMTEVNLLTVTIGSIHGFYVKSPNLRIDLLERIYQATTRSLVLHGGSGIPANMLQNAVIRN